MSIGTLVVGTVIPLGLELSVELSVRATRDESDIEGLVAGVRTESERIDKLRSAYSASAHEAIERLERLKEDTLGLLAALALRIPTEVDAEPGQARGE